MRQLFLFTILVGYSGVFFLGSILFKGEPQIVSVQKITPSEKTLVTEQHFLYRVESAFEVEEIKERNFLSLVILETTGERNEALLEAILKTAKRFSVSPLFLASLSLSESTFNHRATSHKGAKGLLQVMPSTAKEIEEVFSPALELSESRYEEQLTLGITYLQKLQSRYGGDLHCALAAYNAGPARVRKNQSCLENKYAKKIMDRTEKWKTLVALYHEQYRFRA